MSIASALINAGTGLTAAARLADTISNNVANAMTPGYARRETELSSLALGGYGSGVRVAGTVRVAAPQVTAERRAMDAAAGAAKTLTNAYDRMMAAIGEPGGSAALATKATVLESALLAAVAQPQSFAMLSAAAAAAAALAGSINGVAAENQAIRSEADAEIARQVATMNAGLHQIDALNRKIETLAVKGLDTAGLEDERGRVIDALAEIVPLRTVKRAGGQIALYTANGGVLLDGKVWELAFDPGPPVVTPELTVGAGLSPLMQDRGDAAGPTVVPTGAGGGLMDGGSLAALFEVRDKLVPAFDAELDAYAADLIGRFRDLMPGAALAGGEGLFVDAAAGAAVGLAGRIGLNPAVDGDVWRLRDGLGAAAPGDTGFGGYLEAMVDAMTAARAPAGFATLGGANGAAGFAAEITAFFAGQAARSDENRAYLVAQQAILGEREADMVGVDTDAQLQFLMLVEQAYAANARVLTVIDSLMKQLLEI